MESSSLTLAEHIESIKKIPQPELYRLIVDGRLHATEQGWLGYARREPNCLPAVLSAFEFALSNLQELLVSPDLIKGIHKRASSGVKKIAASVMPGEFRSADGGFLLLIGESNQWLTEKGFYEIYDKVANLYSQHGAALSPVAKDYFAELSSPEDFQRRMGQIVHSGLSKEALWARIQAGDAVCFRSPKAEFIDQLTKECCDRYNATIQKARTTDEKYRVIAAFVKDIEQLHDFPDVNGRTSTVLLQRLLIQNGLLPAMLHDPNYIDGYDIDTLIEAIKKGTQNTKHMIDNPGQELFGYKTTTISVNPATTPELTRDTTIQSYYEAEKHLFDFIQRLHLTSVSEERETKEAKPPGPSQFSRQTPTTERGFDPLKAKIAAQDKAYLKPFIRALKTYAGELEDDKSSHTFLWVDFKVKNKAEVLRRLIAKIETTDGQPRNIQEIRQVLDDFYKGKGEQKSDYEILNQSQGVTSLVLGKPSTTVSKITELSNAVDDRMKELTQRPHL